jgi:HEAT repeat protein
MSQSGSRGDAGALRNAGIENAPGAARIDALVRGLSSDNREERLLARKGLVRAGGPAVAPLVALLGDDRDHTAQWEAAKALVEIADPAAVPALIAALEDPGFDIRWLAAEGLIALHRAALPFLLQALAERPQSVWLREGAHHIVCAFPYPSTQKSMADLRAALEGIEPELTVPPAAWTALQELAKSDHR